MMKIQTTISVTEKQIKNGVADSGSHYPVALACKAAGLTDPDIGGGRTNFVAFGGRKFRITKSFSGFITKFDEHRKVNPFTTKVTLIELID